MFSKEHGRVTSHYSTMETSGGLVLGESLEKWKNFRIYFILRNIDVTYDHRLKKTGHPVRSAIHKLEIGKLVLGWVTTRESLLSYVFLFLFGFFPWRCSEFCCRPGGPGGWRWG